MGAVEINFEELEGNLNKKLEGIIVKKCEYHPETDEIKVLFNQQRTFDKYDFHLFNKEVESCLENARTMNDVNLFTEENYNGMKVKIRLI